jgi:MSHA biogenesis protein MshP
MRRESGMSLITAIFLLVILAALGALMVSLSSTQQAEAAIDMQGSRAYHAARAGIEYGAFQAIAGTCAPKVSVTLPSTAPQQFDAFTVVTVSCSTGAPPTYDEGGPPLKTLYVVTANACNQPDAAGFCPNAAPGPNYVERELQLSVINPP